ncbi:uncharacterized protein [Elaeis guineensis]|uniref:uncharacterized protein n=1 Tax=Elaeis guineensis var. tenera TaxID=51953 RepID=UPI003C6D2F2C
MSPSSPPTIVVWVPPPCDHVKVNVNASWSNEKVGLGFLIKDYIGTIVYAETIRTLTHSVPEAELMAAWCALTTTVYHLDFTRVWLEGDSLTVVDWISKHLWDFEHTDVLSSFHPLLADINLCATSLDLFQVSHALREANQLVDSLAGRPTDGSFSSPCSLPCTTSLLAMADLAGVSYFRF